MSESHGCKDARLPEVGLRLRKLRESFGETASEVAQWLGYSPEWIRRVESGHARPGHRTLVALSKHWGVSLEYLRGDPGAERDPKEVLDAKVRLREYLLEHQHEFGPGDAFGNRVRAVLQFLMQVLPDLYSADLLARWFLCGPADLERIMKPDALVPEFVFHQVYRLSGIPETWLWGIHPDLQEAEQSPEMPPRPADETRWRFGPIF